ncbi:MAG: septum formation inhibitor Maf [Clostridia bacterium]|nr:septum formation inhibitor Maf [Clostridia bacterium]
MKVILASKSPRREELLKTVFEEFEIIPSDCEEVVPKNISVKDVAEYLAILKAKDVAKKYRDSLVIGADTVVIVDGEILGKPKDKFEAKRMLKKLSGKTHTVVTGCCLCLNGKMNSFSKSTKVEFYKLTSDEIAEYVKTGEPMDKAGAYGIQGKGALLVKQIDGDYFTVMGLPIAKLKREIDEVLN